MVNEQLQPRGIIDQRVLAAMLKVPRHEFVSGEYLNNAYADYPLGIGEGQTISQPYIVALMTQSLNLKGKEKVLEVGTGSGYQTAILAEISGMVYSVERIGVLAGAARQRLDKLGYKNIEIKVADGTLGWPEFSPFDCIIVTAASPQIPQTLVGQLEDGGLMVIPLGGTYSQVLTRVKKVKQKIQTQDICTCAFVPLVGKYGWKNNGS